MGSRRQSSLSPIHRLLSTRDDLRHLFSYIALAGGPASASREAIRQLRDVTAELNMEFQSEELESAIEFYAVEKSATNASCNRYGNIWAFDRTALRATDGVSAQTEDSSRYLNANIVADGKGNWWVASQVSLNYCMPYSIC
jgi:protein tyrosine phosphatase